MISVFLPCRAGSERVPNKNTKNFCGVVGGLTMLKLKELIKVPQVNRIVVSTDDVQVIEIANTLKSKKIIIDIRPTHLASSTTKTDELVDYVPSIIDDEHILWTHVTSPFIRANTYSMIINEFLHRISNNENDSLMTVNCIRNFLWKNGEPLNYNRKDEKWPRTQTLPKIFEINSGVFLNSRANYLKYRDRIGANPYLYETEGYESFDIDWPDDFILAEYIYKSQKN